MARLQIQYKNYLKRNPDSNYSYEEWMKNVLTPILQKTQNLSDHNSYWTSDNIDTNDREIKFTEISKGISEHLSNLKYDNGDLSDIGNEIGFSLGTLLKDMSKEEINCFIMGFKHGISLTNGTHF